MDLLRVAKPRRNEHSAIGKPVEEGRGTRLPVALQTCGKLRIALRDALENEVVALHVRQARSGLRRQSDRRREREERDCDSGGDPNDA